MERDFHYGDLGIRVQAADEAILDWLAEFLTPAFSIRDDDNGIDQFVALDVDADEFARMYNHGPEPAGTLADCFVLDRGLVQLPLWKGARPGERIGFDRQLAAFYCRDRRRGWTRIVASAPAAGTRVAVMRVVRELTMIHLQRSGWLIVHAAGFVVDGRAIIVAGPKRAGKTTVLMHALHSGATHLIANDRVAIRVGPDGPIARGVPTIVSLRVSTTPRFPGLDDRLLTAGYDYRFTLEEIRHNDLPPAKAPAEAWSLTPIQFCDLLGARLAVQAPVAAILFPSFNDDHREIVVQEVARPDATRALTSAVFPAHGDRALFVGDEPGGGGDNGAATGATCEALVARVRTYECQLGGVPNGDGGWLSLIRQWRE